MTERSRGRYLDRVFANRFVVLLMATLLMVPMTLMGTGGAAVAQTVIKTITVGGNPEDVAVNPVTNKIYIPNSDANDVTVINGATDTVATTVGVGNGPGAIAANPVTNKIYVGNWSDSNISVIDGATDTVTGAPIATPGINPYAFSINPVTNKLYMGSVASNNVTVISGVTDTVLTTAVTGAATWDIDVNPVTNKIYVALVGTNAVSVIDGSTDTLLKTVTVGTDPSALVVNPATNLVYVGNWNSDKVYVIDGSTDTVTGSPITVSTQMYSADANPNTNRIYFTNWGGGNVQVINGPTSAVVATVPVGTNPGGIGVNPMTDKIYVSNNGSNTVSVIYDPHTTWYFAEGYTGAGFQEYLCLGQPVEAPISVDVTYLFKDGTSLERTYDVPALSRRTINVNQEVGPDREVSIKCEAAYPFIAERPMYFDYTGGGGQWTGGHDTVGASSPSLDWYFAEGYTGPGFDEWICVLNPGDQPADLTFRFQTQEEGQKEVTGFSVPAHSRGSFKANQLLDGKSYQTSLALESSQPVVAERPMYFSYQGTNAWNWTGGHCVMGVPTLARDYYFAEGTTRSEFEEWLTLQNPGTDPITINAVYQLGPGQGDPIPKSYVVEGGRRFTVFVPDQVGKIKDVSVHLFSDADFLAERPMYFNYQGTSAWNWTGGHCVIGATGEANSWFFAEGYTGSNFEEWLCLQNTGNDDALVEIIYYPEGGSLPIAKPHTVPANSRYTVLVNTDAGRDLSISAEIASTQPIIVERPMYFNFNGVWTGGHDVVGYAP
ncbi:MAG: hypothetical protein C4536_02750 [Actinobacteria bacterium]|jgi:YVTN family beta-propeller protein|nr:MAG: hypothetical protein C4536_02750 [Actinomycetota bacterium]